MSIIDLFKESIKYANYDFFKLKEEIIALIQIGRGQGLNNPDYCSITVKNSSRNIDYPVTIDLYYKTGEQEAMHLPKSFIVGTFKSIPGRIKQMILQNGFVEIRIENLLELSLSIHDSVASPINFDSITGFAPQDSYKSRSVIIKDDIFTYKVTFSYILSDGSTRSKSISYSDIIGLPSDIYAKMKLNGVCEINLN